MCTTVQFHSFKVNEMKINDHVATTMLLTFLPVKLCLFSMKADFVMVIKENKNSPKESLYSFILNSLSIYILENNNIFMPGLCTDLKITCTKKWSSNYHLINRL